jgi:hypothetical protein
MIETLLYGCRIGEPNYMDEVLYSCKGYVNKEDVMKRGKLWAKENGYDRLRIHIVDLGDVPNFKKSISL